MNRRTCICLLAAATLAACGQPPSPGTPRAMPRAEVTTTSAIATTTSDPPPPPTTTTPPPKPPPPTTTKATVKPTPTPVRPKRLVLPSGLRGSIEQRTPNPFPGVWPGIQADLNKLCPGKVPCVGYTLVIDTSTEITGDCVIVSEGIKVPDPLYEGGKVTFLVNNKNRCTEG
jgi:hypothetical protein